MGSNHCADFSTCRVSNAVPSPTWVILQKINNLHDWHFHSLSSTSYHTDLQHSLLNSISSVSSGICCLTQSLLEPRLFICYTSGTRTRASSQNAYWPPIPWYSPFTWHSPFLNFIVFISGRPITLLIRKSLEILLPTACSSRCKWIGCLIGLEPMTFGTTIRRSNQLNYRHHI